MPVHTLITCIKVTFLEFRHYPTNRTLDGHRRRFLVFWMTLRVNLLESVLLTFTNVRCIYECRCMLSKIPRNGPTSTIPSCVSTADKLLLKKIKAIEVGNFIQIQKSKIKKSQEYLQYGKPFLSALWAGCY